MKYWRQKDQASMGFNNLLAAFICAAGVVLPMEAIGQAQDEGRLSAEQMTQALEASKKARGETTWWRHADAGIILGYDERWKVVNASQATSAIVLSWTSGKSGGLMASCYIELSGVDQSDVAKLRADQIHPNAASIAATILENGRKRDPDSTLLSSRAVIQDNHPAVYIVRRFSVESIQKKSEMTIYSLVTAWNGREVNLECGSSIPVTFPELAFTVEEPIKRLMASLQFVR